MKRLKLLITTICLIGCAGAASITEDFKDYKEKVVAVTSQIAEHKYETKRINKAVKGVAETVIARIEDLKFGQGDNTEALRSYLKGIICAKDNPEKYGVSSDEMTSVLWIYFNQLADTVFN